MAQQNKYRVHEVAKDFDVKSNGIIEMLGTYFEGAKKAQTALTDDELDIIFETLTQGKQVETFDEYFKVTSEKKEEPKQKKQETPAAKEEEKTAEKKPAQDKKPADKKQDAAKKPAQDKKPAEAKPFEKRADKKSVFILLCHILSPP